MTPTNYSCRISSSEGNYDFHKPFGTVVDIGANIGVFTCWAARSSSKVIAVEPELHNFKLLTENIHLNSANAELHRAAIGHASGTIELSLSGAGYHLTTHDFGGGKQTVPVLTLDELLSTVEQVDLLKMDCEGAEYDAFRAFTGWGKVHRIAMEYHAPSINSKAECVRELTAMFTAGGLTVVRHDEYSEFKSGHLFAKR